MDFETIFPTIVGLFIGWFCTAMYFSSTNVSLEKVKSGREFQVERDMWQCTKTKELPYTFNN